MDCSNTSDDPITIKRYANRRLYDPARPGYVGRDFLAGMVRAGEAFIIRDAKTGENVTRDVLAHMIASGGEANEP